MHNKFDNYNKMENKMIYNCESSLFIHHDSEYFKDHYKAKKMSQSAEN